MAPRGTASVAALATIRAAISPPRNRRWGHFWRLQGRGLSGAGKLLDMQKEERPMKLFLLATLVATGAVAATSPDQPTVHLSSVRSLRCVFTDSNITHFRNGQRSTESETESSKI